MLSLDNPVKGEDSKTFMDFLPDTSESNQETASASLRIKELIEDSLIELTSKEEEILRMRYGVGSGDMYTLDEIGTRFGVTRERIRQIEKAALRKIARSGAAETLKGYL